MGWFSFHSFSFIFFSSLLPVEAHLPFWLKRVLTWFKMQVMHFLKYTSMHSRPNNNNNNSNKIKIIKKMNNKKYPISANIQSSSK